MFSVDKEGLILPGGDAPQEASVEIPFKSPEELERSMSAIRKRVLKRRVKNLLPFGRD